MSWRSAFPNKHREDGMFLNKVEIVLSDHTVYIIVLGKIEGKAFDYVE